MQNNNSFKDPNSIKKDARKIKSWGAWSNWNGWPELYFSAG